MTKVIILSIQSQHAVNILKGFKTEELRKSVPKGFSGWAYIYVTLKRPVLINKNYISEFYEVLDTAVKEYKKSAYQDEVLNGKVVARFWFDEYEEVLTQHHIDGEQIERVIKQACIEHEDLDKYVGDRETIYAWHIKKLEIFDEPKELSEFYQFKKKWVHSGMDCPPYVDDVLVQLTKAPQRSVWVYTKEKL